MPPTGWMAGQPGVYAYRNVMMQKQQDCTQAVSLHITVAGPAHKQCWRHLGSVLGSSRQLAQQVMRAPIWPVVWLLFRSSTDLAVVSTPVGRTSCVQSSRRLCGMWVVMPAQHQDQQACPGIQHTLHTNKHTSKICSACSAALVGTCGKLLQHC